MKSFRVHYCAPETGQSQQRIFDADSRPEAIAALLAAEPALSRQDIDRAVFVPG